MQRLISELAFQFTDFQFALPSFKPEEAEVPRNRYYVTSIYLQKVPHPLCFEFISSSLGKRLQKKMKHPPKQLPLLALSSDQSTGTSKKIKQSDTLLQGVYNFKWRQRFQIKLSSHFIVLCKHRKRVYWSF